MEWNSGRGHQGRGSRARVGVSGSTFVRLRAPADGTDVTTSGSWALFSARSIAPNRAGRDPQRIIGAETILLAGPPQSAHGTDSGAVPIGLTTSNTPSYSHSYS